MNTSSQFISLQRICTGFAVALVVMLGSAGNSWAGELEIERASISRDGDTLRVRGKNASGTVTVVYPGDDTVIGTASADHDGDWSLSVDTPDPVPCKVKAESGNESDKRDVRRAPEDSCSNNGGGDPGGGGPGDPGAGFQNQTDFKILMNYELGMHCTGFEFAYCCVLPVYNSILAQVVKPQQGEDDFAELLEGDPNIGRELDVLGRETVLRDPELDKDDQFKKYVLRYWHDAQPRGGQGDPLISNVEGNSLLAWNTIADAAWPDEDGKLRLSGRDGNPLYNGSRDVVLGNCAFGEPDCYDDKGHFPAPNTPVDNYQNAVWNHLYIYQDTEGSNPGETSSESAKLRLGLDVAYPTNVGPAGHAMGPVGSPLENVLTYSGDTGTVVFTQMKLLENLPVTLTSPRIWEALGLPLTPFEDAIDFFGNPGLVTESAVRPYVAMKAQLYDYHTGDAVMDSHDNPVIGFGTAPIDIPNCERCHSELTGSNSAQRPVGADLGERNPEIAALVLQEMAFWKAYYPSLADGAGGSDWYARLKGAAISILAIHDTEHGTGFTDLYPGVECTDPLDCENTNPVPLYPSSLDDPLSYCTNPGATPGTLCTLDAGCNTGATFCDAGNPLTKGNACSTDVACDTGGMCVPDGVCTGSAGTMLSAGDPRLAFPQNTRLGHDSVICQKCHADNVIAVVKSASCGPGNIGCDDGDLIPPLTEALHINHRNVTEYDADGNPGLITFNDKENRDGGCQGCHPAHRSDGDMGGYPITDDGSNYYATQDNRDANGGCFVGRDVHSNPYKDTDGAETPSHLNAVGAWLVNRVAKDTGDWKGIWCTNCHSQLGQEFWKAENMENLVLNIPGPGAINVRGGEVNPDTADVDAELNSVLANIGVDPNLGRSWLDPKTSGSADGLDHTHAIWAPDPGLCQFLADPGNPAHDANVATVEVSIGGGSCSTGQEVGPIDCTAEVGFEFTICGAFDGDGDFSVNLVPWGYDSNGDVCTPPSPFDPESDCIQQSPFCTTPDCVAAAREALGESYTVVPVPMSAATDGRDHWLSPGEPHCADCHAAPYVEQSGNIDAYPPFNYPRKASLMRYSRGHRDITCQGCHESSHGLYPVTPLIDTTSYAQAASLNDDGSHGPLKCATCHDTGSDGLPKRIDDLEYNGERIKDIKDPDARFDAAVGWAHTFTEQANLKEGLCLNCHEDEWDEIGYNEEEWLEHAMKGRTSRHIMDQAEIEKQGFVSGDPEVQNPRSTVCQECHDDEWSEVSCSGEDGREWKEHLIEGRVAEKVWEHVSRLRTGGTTCGW